MCALILVKDGLNFKNSLTPKILKNSPIILCKHYQTSLKSTKAISRRRFESLAEHGQKSNLHGLNMYSRPKIKIAWTKYV